ncbi:MAG: hypothetical protein ACOYJD_01180 [Christensenellales bacterium]|jgi:hypothetical protein
MRSKKIVITAVALAAVVLLTACANLDVIGQKADESFAELLEISKDNVALDDMLGAWGLASPDGAARFLWSNNIGAAGPDLWMEFDARPFIDAGLDMTALPDGVEAAKEGTLLVPGDFGRDAEIGGYEDPYDAFKRIMAMSPDSMQYHMEMDHFTINMGGGNAFEWAKDFDKNDMDIVFVLNPEPFEGAGIDTATIAGWQVLEVETMDENGKMAKRDMLLTSFDLE